MSMNLERKSTVSSPIILQILILFYLMNLISLVLALPLGASHLNLNFVPYGLSDMRPIIADTIGANTVSTSVATDKKEKKRKHKSAENQTVAQTETSTVEAGNGEKKRKKKQKLDTAAKEEKAKTVSLVKAMTGLSSN